MNAGEEQKHPRCAHCKELLEQSKSLDGAILVNTYSPATETRFRAALCGACGLELLEYIIPDSLQDEAYMRDAASLRAAWEVTG